METETSSCAEPHLVLLDEAEEVLFPLAEGVTRVGRSSDSSLVLADASVSRLHCYFVRAGNEVRVFDAWSDNGVRIGGERIADGRLLASGDVIVLGRRRIAFRAPLPPVVPSSPAPRVRRPGSSARRMARRLRRPGGWVLLAASLATAALVACFFLLSSEEDVEEIARVEESPAPPVELVERIFAPVEAPAEPEKVGDSREPPSEREPPEPERRPVGPRREEEPRRPRPDRERRDARQDQPAPEPEEERPERAPRREEARPEPEEERPERAPRREEPRQKPERSPRVEQGEIDRAIDLGVEYLVESQEPDGSWGSHERFELGPTALVLLALLEAGLEDDAPAIRAGFLFLHGKEIATTYEAGVLAMALHALCEATGKKERVPRGRDGKGRHPCRLTPAAREWLARATEFLIDAEEEGTWSYGAKRDRTAPAGARRGAKPPVGPERPDHSNTQYAILGLRAAASCGLPVDPGVWKRVLAHFVEGEGEEARFAEPTSGGGTPRGWGYATADARGETVTMTSAGLAAVAIALEQLELAKAATPGERHEARRSIDDALLWLADRYELDVPAGRGKGPRGAGGVDGYLLYGIERAGVLAPADRIGKHDWYEDGALLLLDAQEDSGAFPGHYGRAIETAFALLFLKRATAPIQVVTGD